MSPSDCAEAFPGPRGEGLLWCSGDLGETPRSALFLFFHRRRLRHKAAVQTGIPSFLTSALEVESDNPAFYFVGQGMTLCLLPHLAPPPHPAPEAWDEGLSGSLDQHVGGCWGASCS